MSSAHATVSDQQTSSMDEQYIVDKIHALMPSPETRPQGVTYSDLTRAVVSDMTETLNSLYRQQKIAVHRTLNDKIIKIK